MRSRSFHKYSAVFLLTMTISIMASCQTAEPIKARSRPPEVTMDNVAKKPIIDMIGREMRNSGFQVRSANDSTLVVGRKSTSELTATVYGSSFTGMAEERIAYSVIDIGNSVKVSADISIVANPGTSLEKITNLNDTEYASSMQASLENLKRSVQANPQAPIQKQDIPATTHRKSLSPATPDSAQLDIYISDIRSKGSISAKMRAAADLYNQGKITKEERNRLQAAISKGEL